MTKQRQRILSGISLSPPLSASQIYSNLKSAGSDIDRATLYRTLNCFVGLGLVGKTQFKGKEAKYELIDEKNHHHHLICDHCGSVSDIPLNEDVLIKGVEGKTKFRVLSHTLEFYGLCRNCQ